MATIRIFGSRRGHWRVCWRLGSGAVDGRDRAAVGATLGRAIDQRLMGSGSETWWKPGRSTGFA